MPLLSPTSPAAPERRLPVPPDLPPETPPDMPPEVQLHTPPQEIPPSGPPEVREPTLPGEHLPISDGPRCGPAVTHALAGPVVDR